MFFQFTRRLHLGLGRVLRHAPCCRPQIGGSPLSTRLMPPQTSAIAPSSKIQEAKAHLQCHIPRGQNLKLPWSAFPQPALEGTDMAFPTPSRPAGAAAAMSSPVQRVGALSASVICRLLHHVSLTITSHHRWKLKGNYLKSDRCLMGIWGGLESQAWRPCREEQGSESHCPGQVPRAPTTLSHN